MSICFLWKRKGSSHSGRRGICVPLALSSSRCDLQSALMMMMMMLRLNLERTASLCLYQHMPYVMIYARSFRLLSSLSSSRTKQTKAKFCSESPPSKVVDDVETLKSSCCGNGCRDCVLIEIGVASCDDYFAKLDAEIAASVSSRDKVEGRT